MINLENYNGPIKFGDEELINAIKQKKQRDLEKTKVTIDLKKLMSIGVEKNSALNLIERLIKKK